MLKFILSVLFLLFIGVVIYNRRMKFQAHKRKIVGLNRNNMHRYKYR